VYTEAFSNNWANAPHRCLRSCVTAAAALEEQDVGETPNLDGVRETVRRFDALAVTRQTTGRIEAMSLWAGESVGAVKRIQPASEILRELIDEAELLLQSLGSEERCDERQEFTAAAAGASPAMT
jgi:nitronate monooxygenase